MPRLALACAVACWSMLLLGPARSDAYLYWSNSDDNTIGRGDLNGAWADQGFIHGTGKPYAVAVDGSHIYWTNAAGYSIGRANLDGSGSEAFIDTTGHPLGLTGDASHVYWTQWPPNGIWRANVDGTGVEQLVPYVIDGVNLAVDGSHIYWSAPVSSPDPAATGGIGRANLDGTGVEQGAGSPEPPFIPGGAQLVSGVAVDASRVYWLNAPYDKPGSIGRANLDGTDLDQALLSGLREPLAVAIDGSHVYWADSANAIGRANLDGTGIDTGLIEGARSPLGLAVDSLSAPLLRFGRVRRHPRLGTATLRIRVLGGGRIALFGRRVKKVVRRVAGPATIALPVKPKRRVRRTLSRRGRLGATVRLRITLRGGATRSRSTRLSLVLRGPRSR